MNWTKQQQQVIDFRKGNLLVSAAAGSGKTAVLVERIIKMIFDSSSPIDIDELLVVTFTKAAAAQMKEKIAAAIEKKIQEEPNNKRYLEQLNLVGDANILTIDSFCYKILKEYFHVISIDPKIQVAEETDLALIREEVISEVMEDFYENNEDFSDFSNAFSLDKDDSNIEEYILRIYELSESYPFPDKWFINAKNNLTINGEEDLMSCLYTRMYIDEIHKDAQEIRNSIMQFLSMSRAENGPSHYEKALLSDIVIVDDIISANTYSLLNNLSGVKFDTLGRAKKSDVFDCDIAETIKSGRDKYKKKINSLLKAFSVPITTIIEQSKIKQRMLSAFVDAAMDFSERFLDRKIASGYVGFSDVEHFALKILCDGTDENGKVLPSRIGRELSEKFQEILIDEYQDSNFLQEYILQCVSRVPYGVNNIFMVGDVKQSIYGFRMARPDLFTDKYEKYADVEENADNDKIFDKENQEKSRDPYSCSKILLNNNFRSRKNVLDFINYVFYQIMNGSIGGIDYTEREALHAGRKYPEYKNDHVEVLLGESKEKQMIMNDDQKITDEHLDDEYIDISGIELEAGMVAERIRNLVGLQGNTPHLITDDNTGNLRPVNYSDIVILFRSPKSYQAVFSEVLMKQNIPVKLQNENGYFDLVEIRSLVTILKMIDNPYNDVECAALLRGFFGRMNNNELAVLILMKREAEERDNSHLYLFEYLSMKVADKDIFMKDFAAVFTAEGGFQDASTDDIDPEIIYEKCCKLLSTVNSYQKMINNISISELIMKVYYDTGFYYYIQSMPEGRERSRNLTLFCDEAVRYERKGLKSLFGFLRFIKKISDKNITLGGDASSEITENVVRIMSIHRSKGLEFPVVFVSGLGKEFNLSDSKSPVILHSDYYIGAKFIDPVKRCSNDCFDRIAMTSMIRLESVAEELRIFYVALTRAKEKLILTGVTPDIVKLIDRMKEVALSDSIRIDYGMLSRFDSYLDFLTASLMRNRVFHDEMKKVIPRTDKKDNMISADYNVNEYIESPVSKLVVKVFYYSEMVGSQIDTGSEQMLLREDMLSNMIKAPSNDYKKLADNLEWVYKDIELSKQKSKLSVTEIKRMYQKEQEEPALENESDASYYGDRNKELLPGFISKEKVIDAAGKGTWYHKAMELIDFTKLDTMDKVKDELDRLYEEGRLIDETRSFITADTIYKFACSDIGKRMRMAANNNLLYKERQFVVGFPVSDNGPDVVVQGIIDAYFEEDGKITLLDYKTDKIKEGQENKLVERYRSQMDYYQNTLEKITGMQVIESYIYSFALNKEIKM